MAATVPTIRCATTSALPATAPCRTGSQLMRESRLQRSQHARQETLDGGRNISLCRRSRLGLRAMPALDPTPWLSATQAARRKCGAPISCLSAGLGHCHWRRLRLQPEWRRRRRPADVAGSGRRAADACRVRCNAPCNVDVPLPTQTLDACQPCTTPGRCSNSPAHRCVRGSIQRGSAGALPNAHVRRVCTMFL